jgi:hypothetical protein
MKQRSPIVTSIAKGAAALALLILYPFAGFTQSRSDSPADQARQARIAELKAKIANLQDQLKKTAAEGQSTSPSGNPGTTSNAGGCCGGGGRGQTSTSTHSSHHPAGALAQAGGGGEHPMGGGAMGGMEGEMGGGGTGGANASPAASPGAESTPASSASPQGMEEHMKGMEHMHCMMGGSGMRGGTNGGQPQASPSGGMGGGMPDNM